MVRGRVIRRLPTRPTRSTTTAIIALVGIVASGLAVLSVPATARPLQPRDEITQPNVVIIMTDDQTPALMEALPTVRREIAKRGVSFVNAHATTPTCCPSRASLLTGNLAQRTEVWTNWLPYGGWEVFHQRGWDDSTIATQLDAAGYATGYIGKYLNGYALHETRVAVTGDGDYVPPGWDSWLTFGKSDDSIAGRHQGYFDYWLMERDGVDQPVTYTFRGDRASDYSTDVFADRAVDFIESVPSQTPLFLVQSVYAPHKPYTPAPRFAKARVKAEPMVPAGIDYTRGKPPWVRAMPALKDGNSRRLIRDQARTLMAVDEGVERILDALTRTDRLRDTIIIFTSDNGLLLGQFNLLGMKNFPYASPVPLAIRWDNAPSGSALAKTGTRDRRLVALADITPTLIEATRAAPAGRMDGMSLLPRDSTRGSLIVSAWRNRGGTDESGSPMPSYCAVRTRTWLYARYATGFEELYDVARDPALLNNVARDRATQATLAHLRKKTRAGCDPHPPDFTWAPRR
jgi:N-acetylglucosamine-6-sulfatase